MGKYEEALERAREIYNAPVATIVTRTFLEQIFPELKESEDERIRKELIGYLAHRADVTPFIDEDEDCKRWLAYLEKQKEQKPVARESDFVSNPKTSVEVLRHYLVWAGNSESEEDCPYTWRALADAIKDGIKALEDQKPAEWNEEDERILNSIIHGLDDLGYTEFCSSSRDQDTPEDREYYEQIEWLKSLRPHWKPSERTLALVKKVADGEMLTGVDQMAMGTLYEQLKKL